MLSYLVYDAQVFSVTIYKSTSVWCLVFLLKFRLNEHKYILNSALNPWNKVHENRELPSYRVQLQPQLNTPEPANQGVEG